MFIIAKNFYHVAESGSNHWSEEKKTLKSWNQTLIRIIILMPNSIKMNASFVALHHL